MGLFHGRDRNGDGYVSPFDTEETQDYVDPATQLEREAREDGRRQGAQRDRSAHNDVQTAAPKTAGRRPNGLATAAFVLAIVSWGLHGPATLTLIVALLAFVFGVVAFAGTLRDPRRLGRIRSAVASVVAVVVLVGWTITAQTLAKAGINPFTSGLSISVSNPLHASSSDADVSKEPPMDDDPQVSEGSGTVTAADDQEKADVAITAVRRAPDTYDGGKTIVVTFGVTNRGDESCRFYDFGYAVYQHGIALAHTTATDYDHATDADPDGLDYYDMRSESSELAPGADATVTVAFELRDGSDIVVEVGSRHSGTYVRRGFTFTDGLDMLSPLPQSDAQAALRGEDEADDSGMFHTWKAYKSGASSLAMAMEVTGVSYAGKDFDGNDYAIVTIRWINESKHPFGFDDFGSFKVEQNGSELRSTVPDSNDASDLARSFDMNSGYARVTPGTAMTVTKAYRLVDVTDGLKVTLDGHRAPSFDRTFDLADAPGASPSASGTGPSEPTSSAPAGQ